MSKKEEELYAERYTTVCNLLETIWAQRLEGNYADIDTDNLLPMTSPQARKLALFVMELFS